MTTLADRLDGIRVQVAVPGTQIYAELRNRDQVTISFGQGVYEWVSEPDLERYMATLARLLFVGWTRQYHAALGEAFRENINDSENQVDRDYLAARSEIESGGRSEDGRVAVTARGMQGISVQIAQGTLRALSEREFVECTRQAVTSLAQDHFSQIAELKKRFYQ